jgi:cytochrome c-type biogenesis protein CcmH/NrfG
VIPLHLGHLPPWAQVMVFVLAFGPFLLLGVAIWVRARQDAAAALAEEAEQSEQPEQPEQTGAAPEDDLSD